MPLDLTSKAGRERGLEAAKRVIASFMFSHTPSRGRDGNFLAARRYLCAYLLRDFARATAAPKIVQQSHR